MVRCDNYSFFTWAGMNFIKDISTIITSSDSDLPPPKTPSDGVSISHCEVIFLVSE